MKKIKVLNLYGGIGGNRKLWDDNKVDVTMVEHSKEIAAIYKHHFPNDIVIIADAHEYLLKHFAEFDFIWSSPPCPSHSMIRKAATHQNKPIFPEMKLYEEILLLKGYFKGVWVVENVVSWYEPLIKPYKYKSHYYWSSFVINGKELEARGHMKNIEELQRIKGFNLTGFSLKNNSKEKVLRNCVEPKSGLEVFNMAFKQKQETLFSVSEDQ